MSHQNTKKKQIKKLKKKFIFKKTVHLKIKFHQCR